MSNSSLVDCKVMSPNHEGKRKHKICRITPHCVVGQLKAENIGYCFVDKDRKASCNYGIGTDGRVCLIVDEANKSWCSSSDSNDQRAVTIECASDLKAPYTMNSAVYNKLIALCVDICKRNNINKLLWFADKNKSLSYEPKDGEAIITVHRWFSNRPCPGDWLYSRLGDVANKVNAQIGNKTLYRVQVGAYGVKSNANKQLEAIKKAGFDAILVKVGNLYKIQVGAYGVKANAENQLVKIKKAGFKDAFITVKE